MALSKTVLGDFELYTIHAGDLKLDGGAMFGVVPKTLWSKGIPADENNRIQMTMRCLLIKSNNTGKIYLIDNGLGNKFNEKMMQIYQVDMSQNNLESSLKEHGFGYEDITDIIFTHLHFDHCGGSSYYNENGENVLRFPNATHHVTKNHWETAIHPNVREKASFLAENIDPLKTTDSLNLVDDEYEYEKGLSTIVVNGHTLGQQLPLIQGDGKKLCFAADLLPTHVHVPLPWVMGYDMYPAETLLEKERFLERAVEESFFLFLEHDFNKEIITLEKDDRRYSIKSTLSLNDL